MRGADEQHGGRLRVRGGSPRQVRRVGHTLLEGSTSTVTRDTDSKGYLEPVVYSGRACNSRMVRRGKVAIAAP